ncbi:MAG: carboxypeptidase regulatory-like domain-containing protein [Planctomycetota bacterium]
MDERPPARRAAPSTLAARDPNTEREQTGASAATIVVAGRCVDLHTRAGLADAIVEHLGVELARASSTGAFHVRVPAPAPGDEVLLRLAADDHLWVSFAVAREQPDPTFEYPLPRSTSVTGIVRALDGAPIANATVRVWAISTAQPLPRIAGLPAGADAERAGLYLETTTEDDGRYRVSGLRPDATYQLHASHDDYRWIERPPDPPGVTFVAVHDGAVVDVELLPIGPVGTIEGTFTWNGEPAAGGLSWHGPSRQGMADVDADGHFRLDRVEVGDVEIRLWLKRYEWPVPLRERSLTRRPVRVEQGATTRIAVDAEARTMVVTGTVRFADGTPAPRQRVRLIDFRDQADTDDGGRFAFTVLQTDAPVLVACAGVLVRARPPAPTELTLPTAVALRLRATDAQDDRVLLARWLVVHRSAGTQDAWALAAPDADGYLVVEQPPGNALVFVAAPGHAPWGESVTVYGNGHEVDLELPPGRQASIRLAADAEPPPIGAQLLWIDEALDLGQIAAAAAARTRFAALGLARELDLAAGGTIPDVGPGRHRLLCSDPEIEIVPEYVDVLPGTDPVIEVRWRRRK